MALFAYLQQVQRFMHDSKQEHLDPGDLISYVNRARREIAIRCQCIRVLTPVSGQVKAVTVTNGGSGYSAPTVTISAPDFPSGTLPQPNGAQATANITDVAGTITAVNIIFGGYGYFQPTVTITDPTGSGAAAFAEVGGINTLNQGQEVYPFSAVDLSQFPGVASILQVKSVSIIYSNYRFSLPVYSMSVYQAMIRQYTGGTYQYVPTFGAQFGQGVGGSFYVYPLPSQTYQMEWDCLCLPSDLISDRDVEALPEPWTDAVPYFAAHLACLELQNMNSARMYHDLFERQANIYSSGSRSGRVTNPYGRF